MVPRPLRSNRGLAMADGKDVNTIIAPVGESVPVPPAPSPSGTTTRAPVRTAVTDGPPGEPSTFARVLQGLGKEVQQGESLTRTAIAAGRTGHDLGATELIALQAGVYRYSEAVDLAAKLVDRVASGLKTVVQGQ